MHCPVSIQTCSLIEHEHPRTVVETLPLSHTEIKHLGLQASGSTNVARVVGAIPLSQLNRARAGEEAGVHIQQHPTVLQGSGMETGNQEWLRDGSYQLRSIGRARLVQALCKAPCPYLVYSI